jgi:hypothetical protein
MLSSTASGQLQSQHECKQQQQQVNTVQLKHKPKKEIMKTKRNGVAKALYTQT